MKTKSKSRKKRHGSEESNYSVDLDTPSKLMRYDKIEDICEDESDFAKNPRGDESEASFEHDDGERVLSPPPQARVDFYDRGQYSDPIADAICQSTQNDNCGHRDPTGWQSPKSQTD